MEYQIQHRRDVEEKKRKEREEEEKIRHYQESVAARDVDVKKKKVGGALVNPELKGCVS